MLELEAAFPGDLDAPRVRQLVGAMIRQLMSAWGYRIEHDAVRVRRSTRFTVGARYERAADWVSPEADDYVREVNARLAWMADNNRPLEERAQVVELEREWLCRRFDADVAERWYSMLEDDLRST